jgi:hypothetical protein
VCFSHQIDMRLIIIIVIFWSVLMKLDIIFSFRLVGMMLAFSLLSTAVEAENAEQAVVKSCAGYITSKEIPEDSVCYEYISGFIDGAVITDSAIIENLTKEKKELSSFFQRAYKTRVGSREKTIPPTYYAKFCLPEHQSRKIIIEDLIHHLDPDVLNKQSFKQTLYDTLKRVYACED